MAINPIQHASELQERKKLLTTKSNLSCNRCRHPLSASAHNLTGEDFDPQPSRGPGDGQNELLATLKQEAKMDQEYLEREADYLKGMIKAK